VVETRPFSQEKKKKEEKVAVKRQLSQDRDNLQEWSVDEE